MWVYSDYIEVKKDFVPVFSEEVDREHPEDWKSFIPHQGLGNILSGLTKALDRASPADKLSIWVHGAYGTGKTFASFVVKHLLEDPLETIEQYFRRYKQLEKDWAKFKAIRARGEYLVVFRSSSAHINSTLKLLVELQQAVKAKLQQKGHAHVVGETFHEVVLDKLTNPKSAVNWKRAFDNHRHEFMDFPSADDVVSKVKSGDVGLTEKITRILEKEGFVLVDSPAAVKTWLGKVIKQNRLQGIVFLWDEFTDFFVKNDQVSGLQELAQATSEMPFYLYLVTHKSLEQFQRIDAETRKKISERFHNIHFEMKPVTAYQLIAHAIHPNRLQEKDWNSIRDNCWGRVENMAGNLLGDMARKEDFRGLVPLHPFSAYVLAKISSQFSSSQRTLFKFLKGEEKNSFNTFLSENPRNGWKWYTADGLWDYFFLDEESDFAQEVRDIVSYQRSRVDVIKEVEEKRVFKLLMLLLALWRQMPGEELLRPTLANLRLIFYDTPVMGELEKIMRSLCDGRFLHAIPYEHNNEEYTIPLVTVDPKKLEAKKQQFIAGNPFDRLVAYPSFNRDAEIGRQLADDFIARGLTSYRQKLIVVSAKDFKSKKDRLTPHLKGYELGTIVVVAQDDDQMSDVEALANELSGGSEQMVYIVCQSSFGKKRWGDWVDYNVHQMYSKDVNDEKNAEFYRKRADSLTDEWLRAVRDGRERIFHGGDSIEVMDIQGYRKELDQITQKIFHCGPEQVSKLETLYKSAYGKGGAEVGLGIAVKTTKQFQEIADKLRDFQANDGFKRYREHALSKMKQTVDHFFESNEPVKLVEVWNALQEAPFGLIPSNIGIALLAFQLKEYSKGYYWSDGTNCFPLNHNKLAEILEHVMKEKKGFEEYEIRQIAPNDEKLCALIREIFRLPPDKILYPEDARKTLRQHLTQIGYPIWVLPYAVEDREFELNLVKEAVAKLDHWLGLAEEGPKKADTGFMGELVNAISDARFHLRAAAAKDHFAKGMRQFIAEKQPAIIQLMQQLDVDLAELMRSLKALLNEEVWIWRAAQVEAYLPELFARFYFVDALNQLCESKKKDVVDINSYFRTQWLPNITKLPVNILAETENEQVGGTIKELWEATTNEVKEYQACLQTAKTLKQSKDAVKRAFASPEEAFRRWIKKHLETDITIEEVKQLLGALPNMLQKQNLAEVKNLVKHQMDLMEKRKLIQSLKDMWQQLTMTPTAADWSENHKVPISWVLEGPQYSMLFGVVDRAEMKTEDELRAAIGTLQERTGELGVLNDQPAVDQRFVAFVADDLKKLIQHPTDVQSLKDHIYSKVGNPVSGWGVKMGEVKKAVKEWEALFYKNKAYEKVLVAIETIPEEQLKGVLKGLAEDPRIGFMLLSLADDSKLRSGR